MSYDGGKKMRRTVICLVTAFLVVGCGGGGGGSSGNGASAGGAGSGSPPPSVPPPDPSPDPIAAIALAKEIAGLPLDDFYDVSFKALQQRDPQSVIADALTDVFPLTGIGLTDVSEESERETYAVYQVVLEALDQYDRDTLDASGKISYDAYRWFLQDKVDEEPFFRHRFLATYSNFGIQEQTRRFFTDLHPVATRRDAENYIARLLLVQEKFDHVTLRLLRQRDAGIVEPSLTIGVAIGQVSSIAGLTPNSTPYYTAFRDKLSAIEALDEEERRALLLAASAAIRTNVLPAYNRLLLVLRQLQSQAPTAIGVGQYPDGRRFYAYALRHHTTTNLTPAEIHQLGREELDRIHHEMRLIFDELGYPQDESLEQLFARVAADGGEIKAEEAIATFEELVDFAAERLPEAFDVFPKASVVVIGGEFGGFYISPSFDGSRPGAFYAGTTEDLPFFDMPSLTFHETLPGHHYQIAIARELDLPPFRQLLHFTGYIEGWGLYAERLAGELGWYEGDPYGKLGQLRFEALRAARLVMDTGIHWLGWSFEQAAEFNNVNVGSSIGSSQGAAGRYSVWPGQATAYMVGMLKIVELRQRAMDALADDFDLREFHRVVIGNGALPLAVLETVVDNYIAERLAGT